MKRAGWCFGVVGWAGMLVFGALAVAWGQIPSVEERTRDSGLNPENCTWKAQDIRLYPVPERAKEAPLLVACYRKDFTLSAAPRHAAITLFPRSSGRYWVAVNGRFAAEPLPVAPRGLRTLDITKFLRPGRNVLTFKGETTSAMGLYLVAEGIVFGQDGSTVRLLTDKSWKGGWNLPAGWDDPDTDPTNLPAADSLGLMRWHTEGEFNAPYYGPIKISPVGMEQPIFDEEKPVELNITLLNMGGAGKLQPALRYEIMDESSRKTVGQGEMTLAHKGNLDWAGTLRYGPLSAGAYRFRFTLTAGGEQVDRRDYEVACVGAMKQRLVEGTHYEEGMDLKPVWSVDCTAEPAPGQFIACDWNGNDIQTRVEEGPAGKYRVVADPNVYSFFAYRFKVKRLFVPHLAVIEWPDDAARRFGVFVWEGTSMFRGGYYWKIGGWARGEEAVFCIDDHPRTNKMQKIHIIYWPNEEEESIGIVDKGGKAKAAAARISVYEIANDIPALKVADAGDHLIGYHTERGPLTMTRTFYAGPQGEWLPSYWAGVDHPEFYRDWYTTTKNMIKRMRFSGQNMYLMGHFMYSGVLYPSPRYIFSQNSYPVGDAQRDYGGLILRMFERNGMSLISGVEYFDTLDLSARDPSLIWPTVAPTIEEVRQGAPTHFVVSRSGQFGPGFFCGPRPVNFFHPKVQESVLTIVDELTELYQDYPSWKGIAFILSRCLGPMGTCALTPKDDPLNYGYEDYTIDLFQKETRIKIPVSAQDPERFQKRYDWLMAHAKEKWIDWRCSQYTRLYCAIRDRLVKGRPDLKLYLLNWEPFSFTKNPESLGGYLATQTAMKQAMRPFGFDVEALRKEPGIVVSYSYLSPGTAQSTGFDPDAYRQLSRNQLWQDNFANDGKGGAYIWSGFTEPSIKLPKGKWLFEFGAGIAHSYPWPPGPYINDTFVNVMVRSNPTLMPHTWIDTTEPGGHLHEMRLFARAYRSLPNGKYRRLTGQGRDANVWIEECSARGARYAYVANTHWWDTDVALTFPTGAKVRDLIRDLRVRLEKNQWRFRLGPYSVQSFRVEGSSGVDSVAAASVRARPLADPGPQITAAAEEAEGALTWVKDHPDLPLADDQKAALRALTEGLARIADRRQKGDLAGAYEIATSWEFRRAPAVVTAITIPWALIGPFDNKDRAGFDQAYAPEADYLAGKPYQPRYQTLAGESAWKQKQAGLDGLIDLDPLFAPNENVVAYAATEVYSPTEQPVVFHVGTDDGFKLWVNGKLMGQYNGQRNVAPDQNRVPAQLVQGWNRILLKADNVLGAWAFILTITDPQGNVLGDLRFRLPAGTAK